MRIRRRKTHFDDAALTAARQLVPAEGSSFRFFLKDHVSTNVFRVPQPKQPATRDRRFMTNNELWEAILLERVRAPMHIVLDSFFIFEWIPRSPGLFHTDGAVAARREAAYHIMQVYDGMVVYSPKGKQSMLDGGLGCLRLKPINDLWFLSASATGTAHEGIPIAMEADLYESCTDEIAERGALVRDVHAELTFIPAELEKLYADYREVPKVYLRVTELRKPAHPQSRSGAGLTVSVAATFEGVWEKRHGVYVTYANFDPGTPASFRETVEWLEQEYVQRLHQGRILTDFDQQRSHFANAPFSLAKVMSGTLQIAEVRDALARIGDMDDTEEILIGGQRRLAIYMANFNNFGNVQGTFGQNFGTVNVNQPLSTVDGAALAAELRRLRDELPRDEQDDAITNTATTALSAAANAADRGDNGGVLANLKTAGRWVLDVATRITATLAAEWIKASLQ